MKIVNNYDLIEKINDSKGNLFSLKRVLNNILLAVGLLAAIIAIDSIPGVKEEGVDYKEAFNWFAKTVSLAFGGEMASRFLLKYQREISSDSDLLRLIVIFREAGIKTDLELLKEAKEDTVEYKFINEDARLKLRENKYILVPTNDGFGGIKDVSVLQEHNIGSKVYVLSLGSPKKYAKPVRVYN